MREKILLAIIDWANAHNGSYNYVSCRNPKAAEMDGSFDLAELADRIVAILEPKS